MDYNEYKKSYKGFIAFLILHFSALICASIFSVYKDFIPLVLVANILTIGLTGLMYIIYRTENIYWMNGIEYERALLVGSERRKTFALKHLNCIGRAAIFGVIITIAGILFNWSQFITFPIILIAFIIACISTVNIEL